MTGIDPVFAAAAAVHETYGGDWVGGDPSDLRRRYDAARAGLAGDAAPGVTIDPFALEGASGLQFRPAESGTPVSGAVVYFHGGSWMVGSPETHMVPCSWLAALAGVPVFSCRYRLAPDHPFPSQREDGVQAALSVLDRVERVVLAGDSAGAAVAFWTAQAIPVPAQDRVVGVLGFYGAYGRLSDGDDKAGNEEPGLSRPELIAAYRRLGELDALAAAPGFSIINASESIGPPCYLSCGTEDAVLEDSIALTARLRELGRPVTLDLAEALPHSFAHYAGRVPAARQAVERAAKWVRRAFAMA